ncbi:MAG: XdhC family protein [Pararhodobacter sp.]|nr:XdhC family protein [Pararhodobacter sp.]
MHHDTIPECALDWHRSGAGAALATVIETWGSAPRQAGSQLAISGAAEIMGSVSGGCVEGAVVAEALEALADGSPRILTYGVSDENAFAVGLACGGTIRILVEPVGAAMPEAMLERLVAARARREPMIYGVTPDGWARRLVAQADLAAAPDADLLAQRFRSGKSGVSEAGEFLAVFSPPLRLFVVGAVHIAQALVPMAKLAGYDPVVIDPREAFASPDRFPDTALSHDWPDEALEALHIDPRCAVVTLTHDAKLDDPALRVALARDPFYIGALGSTRTRDKRAARLRDAGFDADQIARIHAPVGLAIGAVTPAEIALSILAQMSQVLRAAP